MALLARRFTSRVQFVCSVSVLVLFHALLLLPEPKDVHVGLTGNSEFSIDVSLTACSCVSLSLCYHEIGYQSKVSKIHCAEE